MTNLTELTPQELKDLLKETKKTFCTLPLTEDQANKLGKLLNDAKAELETRE